MRQREFWRCGLRLDRGAVLALQNARRGKEAQGNPKYDRRLRAILLVGGDHYTQEAAAKILEVDTNSVTRWVMAYQGGGLDALRIQKGKGRKPRLTEDQLRRLAKWIENGPEDFGLDTGVWTGPLVKLVIESKFHVEYSVEQARRILHKLGFSVQYPKQVLSEASLKEQERWLRRTLPEIKKKRRKKGASSCSRTSASSSSRAPSTEPGHGEV